MLVPLMKRVADLHLAGLAARLTPNDILETADGSLELAFPQGIERSYNEAKLRQIQPHSGSALKVVGEYRVTVDSETGIETADLRAAGGESEITKPVYLTDYRCWEIEIGHHDERTDVFAMGLLLASLACGLDFADIHDVESFSSRRTNLFLINRALHPVVATLIVEMTALNRSERAADMGSLAKRLETYRDQPVGLDIERVLSGSQGVPKRRTAVLSHVRDRLFDLSRRNRLVHFRSTQASVNFTVASVPVVLRLESVRTEHLCTWNGAFAADVLSGREVPLAKWLRFEDQPYLNSALDRIIQDARRDRAEYGFSSLRLVVAFLHWHNLKDSPDDRITSPLLWIPIEIVKSKGVRDQYMMKCTENEAEFNPALRHYLRQLYEIHLPETVDLRETSIADIHRDLEVQIHKTEPGVSLALQDKPVINLIHQKAVQRLRQFQRRRGITKSDANLARPDFSYDKDDYRPLGLALFDKYVRPRPLPQRIATGGGSEVRTQFIMAEPKSAERLTYALGSSDGHRYKWEIDLTQITAANFNYKKMSLVRDYNTLIDNVVEQPSFDRVFSIEPRAFESDVPPSLASSDRWGVVAADNTQNAAIALARTGRSFIIQGPPGTGKSQTITNLIADYAARRKRVLFVCEKRAALDVVFHRLQQAGLDRLSCLVHDSQEDKKTFVYDLKDCYEQWGFNDPNLEYLQNMRLRTVEALDRHIGSIEAFERSMGSLSYGGATTLRALVRRLIALPEPQLDLSPGDRERLPGPDAWDANRDLANRVSHFMAERFGQQSLAGHPFGLLSAATINSTNCYSEVESLIATGQQLLDRLEGILETEGAAITGASSLSEALESVRCARRAIDCGLARNLDALDPKSASSKELGRLNTKVAKAEKAYIKAAEKAKNWHNPLTPEDAEAALELARNQEGSFFKFLNGGWRRLKATVHERYNFKAHAVPPKITTVLEHLVAMHHADSERAAEHNVLVHDFGIQNLDAMIEVRDDLAAKSTVSATLRSMLASAKAASDPQQYLAQAAGVLPEFESLAALISDKMACPEGATIDFVATALRDLQESLDDLPDCLPLLRLVAAADPLVSLALRTYACSPEVLEALVVEEAITRASRQDPALLRFDFTQLAASSRRAARAEMLIRDENALVIRAGLHTAFRDNVKLSTISATQLDSDGKQFKKRYATGRREIEHEFGKTMRFRSIRELSGGDTGAVVNDLKPIWLMSPLSVSDTLPLDADLFDVVIFDEASQIPTEEAVPAMCRARQVIVVGDEMQLPPTSFFSTALDEDDMQVITEEEGEQIAIMLDADSLLNQAARTLPATMLAWHYRSRSEALISFSNAAFYEGRLVTIPDHGIPEPTEAVASIKSDDETAAGRGVERLLERPITYHHMGDGLYEKRANTPEARYISELVRSLLQREAGLSIGIVAFSEAQQTEIESALEGLAARDPIFAARVEQEYVREDDGQFNGLFIKNLENVQGDERDVIILSICYAPGRDGKMVMNFGPINQRGGEKRLNVIFSRARHHMAIVSTIRPEAITNTHNDGARALRTFLAFAQAQDSGAFEHAQAILATVNPDAERVFARKPVDDPLCLAISDELQLRGHEVRLNVGSAGFRCDIAIVDPDGDKYALAILLDGGNWDSRDKVSERFVFRPKILKAFGWRVIDIPSTDWLRDKDSVLDGIEAAMDDSLREEDDNPFDDSLPPIPKPSVVTRSDESPGESESDAEDAPFEEYHYNQGTSSKFWKIAVSGAEVVVVFGRIGTKGTRVTKVFESNEKAMREATKLILEKTKKGYEAV